MSDLMIAIATLMVTTISIIVAGVWKLTTVRDELKDAITGNRLELEKKMDDEMEEIRRQFGETITALREKLTQIELYIRDNYVSKNSFNTVLDRILVEMKSISEKVESRFLRMETEIKNAFLRRRDPEQP